MNQSINYDKKAKQPKPKSNGLSRVPPRHARHEVKFKFSNQGGFKQTRNKRECKHRTRSGFKGNQSHMHQHFQAKGRQQDEKQSQG